MYNTFFEIFYREIFKMLIRFQTTIFLKSGFKDFFYYLIGKTNFQDVPDPNPYF